MFELKTKGSDGWKTIIGLSFSLNEEAVIDVTEKGLDFKVMDIDKSGLVDFIWEAKDMISYKCEQPQKIGIRTDDLNKILKRAGKDDDITISHDGKDRLKIGIGDSKSYEIRLVDTEQITTGSSPKVQYENQVSVPFSVLKEKVDDMSIIGQFMNINMKNGEIAFNITGDFQKGQTIYKNETIKVAKESSGNFSLSHLDNALRSVSKVDNVELCLQDTFPLCMMMSLPDMGNIKYYLAPFVAKN